MEEKGVGGEELRFHTGMSFFPFPNPGLQNICFVKIPGHLRFVDYRYFVSCVTGHSSFVH